MPRRTSPADVTPLRVVLVTLDGHLGGAAQRAFDQLSRQAPGLHCTLHCAGEWAANERALEQCRADIERADIVIACMLFMDDHIQAVLPQLAARREHCDAMLCFISAPEVMRLTRIGKFSMDRGQGGPLALFKRLRGKGGSKTSSGERQVQMLRRIPKLLKYVPGTAQDLRAYLLAMQYWLAGSQDNIRNLVAMMVTRYAAGPRRAVAQALRVDAPVDYPDVGLYHPEIPGRVSDDADDLPRAGKDARSVGLLLMRSYVLAGNTRHYDAVIAALEARGLRVVPAYASGLDGRPAIDRFFRAENGSSVDAVISLTGFSLIGGPTYNDADAAEELLAGLDVPYIAAHATEFQTLEQWQASEHGLLPVETTMMVAIPELDGAIGPTLFGGRSDAAEGGHPRDMQPCMERAAALAERVQRLVRLRSRPRDERRVAVVLFNFPPNAGATGTAAHLAVYRSLFNTLRRLRDEGYDVEVPDSVDALRDAILHGNGDDHGFGCNVVDWVSADDLVRGEPWLDEVESAWGPAPGKHQSNGRAVAVLGARFGNVMVAVQPAFGYEGDPMRLLFDRTLAPTHAMVAFYRYLRERFEADAVLHFGTHGALEFMPGKQAGLGEQCWPERLLGGLPNFYLYAANNPSEGTIAKRRSAATLISYLTPPVAHAGLYRGLIDLKDVLDQWRGLPPGDRAREELIPLIQAQAAELELVEAEPPRGETAEAGIARLAAAVVELEHTLIPHGLHVVGEAPSEAERADLLCAVAEAAHATRPEPAAVLALVRGLAPEDALAAGGMEANEAHLAL
ncbi:MAG: magnesium chelatase subunit H, partial [Xanthomonadales bacterium]|nr:magnesium chelatase subunit H [Xanthomonadales bacterium]